MSTNTYYAPRKEIWAAHKEPSDDDVAAYAKWLGVAPSMHWLAKEGLKPAQWKLVAGDGGTFSRESLEQPGVVVSDAEWDQLVKHWVAQAAKGDDAPSAGAAAGASVEDSPPPRAVDGGVVAAPEPLNTPIGGGEPKIRHTTVPVVGAPVAATAATDRRPKGGEGCGAVPEAEGKKPAGESDEPSRAEQVITALTTVPDWVSLHPLLAHYVSEGVGTFFFALSIALVGKNNSSLVAPIPIGFMLMAMVFTFGYISGGHFNPAVSFAVMLTKMDDKWKLLGYMVCQTGAALGAGIVAMIVEGNRDLVVPKVHGNQAEYVRKGLFAELIFSFALATVVLHVAYSRQKHNFFYGFSIGMVVLAGASAVGGVSGGAFNPAIATGLQAAACIVGRCEALMHFWLYWVAPCTGAGLASVVFLQMDTGLNHD